ncbi:hypothetical protein FRX31_033928 [Thalictrum thalictroides]|uniref:Uncharacterized protein n=1 Tax=Thalictrum thalictroides TaxID=46969 RepID=A0A7J6UVI8_THATH|nr:hypothetical protein FRX31_033928 [Thalictrum thalictroides]
MNDVLVEVKGPKGVTSTQIASSKYRSAAGALYSRGSARFTRERYLYAERYIHAGALDSRGSAIFTQSAIFTRER